jgi:hypothetical protein
MHIRAIYGETFFVARFSENETVSGTFLDFTKLNTHRSKLFIALRYRCNKEKNNERLEILEI